MLVAVVNKSSLCLETQVDKEKYGKTIINMVRAIAAVLIEYYGTTDMETTDSFAGKSWKLCYS